MVINMCNTKIRFKLNSCYISREKTDFEEPCNGIVYDHYQFKSITRPNRKIADITLIKSIKSNKIHLCIHIPNRHFELDKNYIFSIKIIDYMIHFYDMKCDIETDIGKWFSSVKDINSSGYFKFRVTELFNTLDKLYMYSEQIPDDEKTRICNPCPMLIYIRKDTYDTKSDLIHI